MGLSAIYNWATGDSHNSVPIWSPQTYLEWVGGLGESENRSKYNW